jgi:hypothetical protein
LLVVRIDTQCLFELLDRRLRLTCRREHRA